MRFSLLGALEAAGENGPVALGGINQGATLGYLLLHANKVVPTSDLIHALWGDAVPPTARKMVQNAIAGLRRALSADPSVELLTVRPGYIIRVDPERIDIRRFHALVDQGSADFQAERWEPAARRLREALSLWRGPVLADLSAMGVADWPETTILGERRLTAIEDWLEAELALGRHHEKIGEMTTLVQREPARERLSGLLMLGLYRCGRQQEALAVHQRLRDTLREGFGLDPAPKLQALERAMLNQDPSLDLTRPLTPQRAFDTLPATVPNPSSEALAGGAGRPAAEAKRASVVLVRTRPAEGDEVEEVTRKLDAALHEEARRFGGTVRDSPGADRSIVFGFPRCHEDDPERAVHAALAVRDRMNGRLSAAVATGQVMAAYRHEFDFTQAQLSGSVLDEAVHLLVHAGPGRVRVCRRTAAAVGLPGVHADDGQEVTALPPGPRPAPVPPGGALVGRERELEILRGLLGDARTRRRPHMVTVLGEPGIGRSRLIAGFTEERALPVLTGRVPPFAGGPLAPLAASVRSRPDGEPLARQIEESPFDQGMAAWLRHVERLAGQGPVTVVLEDLHHADRALLDHVENLTEYLAGLPVLVVVTARTEFRERRPYWGCGKRDVSTLTLDPLPDEAMAAFLPAPVDPELLALAGGNPTYALEYARALHEHDGLPPVPDRVRALIAARIDTLPVPERVVLRDAAILRERIRPTGVAVLSGLDLDRVRTVMRTLARGDFLVARQPADRFYAAEPDEPEYSFVQPLLCEVAGSQVPRREQIAGHRSAIGWITRLPAGDADLLIHHYRQLLALTPAEAAAGLAASAHDTLAEAADRACAAGAHDVAARCHEAVAELRGTPV